MFKELFPGERNDDLLAAFSQTIKEFGRWADSYCDQHGKISREIIYAEHFVAPGSKVSEGAFREMDNFQLQFAKKKLVDLKYNANMPDAIGRYTFTPYAMPTRSALADDFQIGKISSNDVEDLIAHKLSGEFARRFHADSSKQMYLPFLEELTMQDVAHIRQLPSRNPFISQQKTILENPLAITENLAAYQNAFEAFQRELSDWYVMKYHRDPMERRLQNFATVGINFGGRILIFGLSGELELLGSDLMERMVGEAALDMVKGKVKGVAVKLMLKVYDFINKRFDENLSFNIEMMRTETSYTANEINNLVEKVKQQSLLLKEQVISAEADTN
jgi:ribosomal protein S17E